jgi:Na+/serine symporter
MVQGYEILKKLTTRNYLAVVTATVFLGVVWYGVTHPELTQTALENPLITYILGTFTAVVLLIYNFFFRKPQAKESTG